MLTLVLHAFVSIQPHKLYTLLHDLPSPVACFSHGLACHFGTLLAQFLCFVDTLTDSLLACNCETKRLNKKRISYHLNVDESKYVLKTNLRILFINSYTQIKFDSYITVQKD